MANEPHFPFSKSLWSSRASGQVVQPAEEAKDHVNARYVYLADVNFYPGAAQRKPSQLDHAVCSVRRGLRRAGASWRCDEERHREDDRRDRTGYGERSADQLSTICNYDWALVDFVFFFKQKPAYEM